MDRKMLRDDQWERIEQLLPGKASDRGVTAKDNRRFVEAVLWIMRTGSPWHDLPEELGHWHRTYRPLLALARERCMGACRDGAARRCRHGASVHRLDDRPCPPAFGRRPKKAGGQEIGRSRGGLTTKLHVAVDALGNPLRVILSAGQIADIAHATALIKDQPAEFIVADKGYDADAFVDNHRGTRQPGRHSASLQPSQSTYVRSAYLQETAI